jgi:tRNA A37 threonylcarbamoyltransferase TsaD
MRTKGESINILGIETSCDETAAAVSPSLIVLVAF